jgi:hypothetical protein
MRDAYGDYAKKLSACGHLAQAEENHIIREDMLTLQ